MPILVNSDQLRTIGLGAGLAAVGVTHAGVFNEARQTLKDRKALGLDGGMQFTYRNPDRSTDPQRTLEGARSLVVGAYAYSAPPTVPPSPTRAATESGDNTGVPGRIAAYAWRDHYAELRTGLGAIATALIEAGHDARVLADDNALVDRSAAVRAGLGWFGKNSNVLLPRRGSWFVLGAVLTSAELVADEPATPRCGPCRRCIDGCPTDAIVAEGVVDARRCLAWLLQLGGVFPAEFRVALGDRIYGCDDCQEVCPPNRESPAELLGDEVATTDLLGILTDPDEAIMARHGRWYIPDRDPRYLRRNALLAFANTVTDGAAEIEPTLRRFLTSDDAMLVAHAVWATKRLGRPDLLALLVDSPLGADPIVREELGRSVAPRSLDIGSDEDCASGGGGR